MTASVAVAPFTITDLGVHDEAIWAFTMAEIRMEGLVADEYVTFDDGAGAFQLTDKGRAFLENQGS